MKKICVIVLLVLLHTLTVKAQWVKILDANSYTRVFSGSPSGNLFTTAYGGIYKTTNNGGNWTLCNPGIPAGTAMTSVSVSDSALYACTGSAVYKSTNIGANWTVLVSGYNGINSLYTAGNYVFFNTYSAISRSTNNGANFSYVISGLPSGISIQCVTGSAGRLYTAGLLSSGVYTSTNNGDNWTKAGTEIPSGIGTYSLFASGNIVMAGTDNGVYISTNYGTNWRLIQGILAPYGYYGFARNLNRLFISGWGLGVYASTDLGQSWFFWNQGINDGLCNGMYYFNNYVYCGTITAVYRRPYSDVGINTISSDIPEEFKLYQNYPNPFNPTTKIKFSVPSTGKTKTENTLITLTVYDILGREAARPLSQRLKPGTYEVTFDGGTLESGTYFYVLRADEFRDTRKFILLK